jgi:hypothetical protein
MASAYRHCGAFELRVGANYLGIGGHQSRGLAALQLIPDRFSKRGNTAHSSKACSMRL